MNDLPPLGVATHAERRHQDADENRNDRDHDEQLNQCERVMTSPRNAGSSACGKPPDASSTPDGSGKQPRVVGCSKTYRIGRFKDWSDMTEASGFVIGRYCLSSLLI